MRERGATRRGEHERGDGIIVSFIFDMFVEFAEFLDSTPEIEISVLPVTTHVVNVIAPARRAEGRRSDPVVSGVIPARATFGARLRRRFKNIRKFDESAPGGRAALWVHSTMNQHPPCGTLDGIERRSESVSVPMARARAAGGGRTARGRKRARRSAIGPETTVRNRVESALRRTRGRKPREKSA